MFALFVYFLAFLGSSSVIRAEDELLSVTLIYRHGDRTPLSFYPNDPYKDPSFWPKPLGELTNIGMMQHFELGNWLRDRYNSFLSEIYNSSEIYIHSSDADRCLMSAACNLAGLYPPKRSDIWNADLLWQPIPIHTTRRERDSVIDPSGSCPKYKDFIYEAHKLPHFKQIEEENKKFYEFLTMKSGKNISNISDATSLHDTLWIEKLYNLTLPTWATEAYPKLNNISLISVKLPTSTSQLAKLSIGRFFHTVISQFKHHQNETFEEVIREHKFKVFSGHDMNIYPILDVLRVPYTETIPYAATVIFELWKSELDQRYIQVLYKEKTGANIVQIAGCGLKCEFDKFIQITAPYSLSQNEFCRECQ